MSSEMRITRNNYEIFFLDFFEGRLNAELRRELMAFLDRNPDLKDEFHSYDDPGLTVATVGFPGKKGLYKDHIPVEGITPGNVEEMIIASMENDLTEEGSEALEKFLEINPAYAATMELYAKTKLIPPQVVFPGKRALKKRSGRGKVIYLASIAAAASVILFIFLGRVFYEPPYPETQTLPVARMEPIKESDLTSPVLTLEPKEAEPVPLRFYEGPAVSRETTGAIRMPSLARASITGDQEAFVNKYLISRYEETENAGLLLARLSDEDKPGSRSMVGRVLAGLFQNAKEVVSGGQQDIERDEFSIWTLADLGIKGYNTIADRDIDLETYTSKETGKVSAYQITENDEILRSRVLKQEP